MPNTNKRKAPEIKLNAAACQNHKMMRTENLTTKDNINAQNDSQQDFKKFIEDLRKPNQKNYKTNYAQATQLWNTVYYPIITADTILSELEWNEIFEKLPRKIRNSILNSLQNESKPKNKDKKRWSSEKIKKNCSDLFTQASLKTLNSILLSYIQEKEWETILKSLPRKFHPMLLENPKYILMVFEVVINRKRQNIQKEVWDNYPNFPQKYIETYFKNITNDKKINKFKELLPKRICLKILSDLWENEYLNLKNICLSRDSVYKDESDQNNAIILLFKAAILSRCATICNDLFDNNRPLLLNRYKMLLAKELSIDDETIKNKDENNKPVLSIIEEIRSIAYGKLWYIFFTVIQNNLASLSKLDDFTVFIPESKNPALNKIHKLLVDLQQCQNSAQGILDCTCQAHKALKEKCEKNLKNNLLEGPVDDHEEEYETQLSPEECENTLPNDPEVNDVLKTACQEIWMQTTSPEECENTLLNDTQLNNSLVNPSILSDAWDTLNTNTPWWNIPGASLNKEEKQLIEQVLKAPQENDLPLFLDHLDPNQSHYRQMKDPEAQKKESQSQQHEEEGIITLYNIINKTHCAFFTPNTAPATTTTTTSPSSTKDTTTFTLHHS